MWSQSQLKCVAQYIILQQTPFVIKYAFRVSVWPTLSMQRHPQLDGAPHDAVRVRRLIVSRRRSQLVGRVGEEQRRGVQQQSADASRLGLVRDANRLVGGEFVG